MNRMKAAAGVAGAALIVCTASPAIVSAQQVTPQALPAQPPTTQSPPAARPTLPSETPRGQAPAQGRRLGGVLQGFSVVLAIGELQGTNATDDVPPAARKALADMRDFLPYKSYRLLDAAWLMCCGEQTRTLTSERRPTESSTLALRGPDDNEYELHLSSGRAEGGRVFVQFNLLASHAFAPAASGATTTRTLQRRIADLDDKAELLRKQIADVKRRVEVGVTPGTEIPRMELELRSTQREVAELRERLESSTTTRGSGGARGPADRAVRSVVIDTSFTMEVGETVVVGASRPRGATKALIALVTAVPRAGAGGTRE
jgi:hypothetical protein